MNSNLKLQGTYSEYIITFWCNIAKVHSINILNSNGKYAQQDVPHYHMHLIPRKKDDKKLFKWGKQEVNHKKLLEKIGDIEI